MTPILPRILSVLFLALALSAPAAPLLVRSSDPLPEAPPPMPPAAAAGEAGGASAGPTLASLARKRTPFRAGGRPPLVRYGESPPPPPPPRAVVERPRLLVTGILWGRQPVALIEGIPGLDQAVTLAEGGAAGGVQVTRIERELVTVTGQDTTWTLTVRNPWE